VKALLNDSLQKSAYPDGATEKSGDLYAMNAKLRYEAAILAMEEKHDASATADHYPYAREG
jgi:hypothetical protein